MGKKEGFSMRTITGRIIDFVVYPNKGERKYGVNGHIVFVSFFCLDIELVSLRRHIIDIDRQFPWSDESFAEGRMGSIKYLSEGKCVTRRFYGGRSNYFWFDIYPYGSLRKGQVYAYEKYLAKIAEELAKRRIPGVDLVQGIIEMRSSTSFRVN